MPCPHRLALLLLLPAVAACARSARPPAAGPAARYDAGTLVARFADDRIRESSGLAASGRSDDYFFTHNDSGDQPVLYAVDRGGKTVAAWRVEGAAALDWEDMARGPDEQGRPSLYLGDIGDNLRLRPHVTVYRIPEPELPAAPSAEPGRTAPAAAFHLRYPDGTHDAEALLVHPRTGRLLIVTKHAETSAVYAAPERLQPGQVYTMRRIGVVRFGDLPATPGDPQGSRLATGGDFAPDASRLVVRTYTDAYEWDVPGGDVEKAFQARPVPVPLPAGRGGEAIAYGSGGRSLFVSTEGRNAPVHELRRR